MVKYLEHNDREILVPRHISRFCIYTSQLILFNSIIIYKHHYNLLAFLNLCLYLSTIVHWQKVKHGGIERKIDVCCVITTLSYATYTSFLMPYFYTYLWLVSLLTSSLIFYVNEKLLYYQVLQYNNKKIDKSIYKDKVSFHYFSFEYTNPDTFEREVAYYRNVVTHGLGLHVLLCLSSMYCVIYNPYILL
jgi:hypothetical protein